MRRPRLAVVVLGTVMLVAGLPAGASADTVELLNGSRVRGKITKLTDTSVSVTTPQGMTMTVPLKQVHAISDKNGRRVINEKKSVGTPEASRGRTTGRAPRKRRGGAPGRKQEKPVDTTPAYKKELWPPAKLLVWANPGQGGNFKDASKWKGGGAPNKDTDILLPASDKPYVVNASRGCYCRHCTIEKNAAIIGKHGGGPFTVWGNCWVKEGGRIHFVDVVGPKHTFFRLDGGQHGKYVWTAKGWAGPWAQPTATSHIHHKMQVTKFQGGSVEFIGNVGVGDEFYLSRGRMIVSGDFRYNGSAGKGTFEVFDGAVLELQTGGCVAPQKALSSMNIYNMSVYRGGTIQAGSPGRPLTGDTYLRLGFDGAANSGRNGLYCAQGSKIRVYSADPRKARLVITGVEHAGSPAASGSSKGVEVHLGGDVELDGVLFDCVRQGGIRVADTGITKKWKNVSLGSRNAGGMDQLVAQLVVDTDIYYHDRVYMRFGRVLGGLKMMQSATGQKIDIIYPTSGKIFTHGGRVTWAPGGRQAAEQKKYDKDPPQAQELIGAIEKTADKLRRKVPRGKKPTDPRFVQRHRKDLVAMGRGALALRKNFPDTESCRRALAIAAEFGIKLPKG